MNRTCWRARRRSDGGGRAQRQRDGGAGASGAASVAQRVAGARAFRSIEASGREALVELRRLLAVLRTSDEQLAIAPQPGLGSLTSLVEQVRESGPSLRQCAIGPFKLFGASLRGRCAWTSL
jgi:hypothetical protein